MVWAGDHARPILLSEPNDRCICHDDLLIPIVGDDHMGTSQLVFAGACSVPRSAGQLAGHGQLMVHPVSGGDEMVQLCNHGR